MLIPVTFKKDGITFLSWENTNKHFRTATNAAAYTFFRFYSIYYH